MAYTLLDLTTSVQDDLKDPAFSSTRIRHYLNHGQKVIFATHDFKFCEKFVSGALTAGKYTFAQQADHESTIGGTLVNPLTNEVVFKLTEKNYLGHRDFFEKYPAPSTSTNQLPGQWTEFGTQMYFSTPVDISYILQQRYYRIPTDMDSNDSVPDVPVTFRELLETWALYRGEKYRGNHDVAATYRQDFEDGLENMALKFSTITAAGPTIARQTRRRV